MADTDEILVMTALNEEEAAQEMLVDLVREGFILSGTYYQVKIVFQWEGQVHFDEEYKLMMKARAGYYPDIEKYIMENHPYRAPEVIKIPASFGSPQFREHLMANKRMD
ncbi:MAG: divalent-cation tolerance protein CutA [Spirochaetales bacterium]|nr:divalent-cation tolerance protein CutA [Leptospiraceae bacterium]MCP5479885.1 divalent-cation tolerance protein CutA [Spirochaetales bacterium]MCP5486275.1 divalent-cation tolerance protein CutA [Spirochaetales bacterium]